MPVVRERWRCPFRCATPASPVPPAAIHRSAAPRALDVTEPSGRHLKTCHLSVGAPAPFHLAVPSKPLSPGIRVGVDRMRPSGDPDDENVNQSNSISPIDRRLSKATFPEKSDTA